MKQRFTITAVTENTPGVLHRLTSVFTRRKMNIESLTVSETEKEGISRFTVTLFSDPVSINKIVSAIKRIVETIDVFACTDKDLLYKEIAFLRVGFKGEDEKKAIEQIAKEENATLVMTNGKTVVIEKTGIEEEIDAFEKKCRDKFILIRTFIRSGRIAIKREIGDLVTGKGI